MERNGLAPLVIVGIVLGIVVLAVAVWVLVRTATAPAANTPVGTSPVSSSTPTSSSPGGAAPSILASSSPSSTASSYAGLATYIDNSNDFSIQYPATYKLVTSTVDVQIFTDTEQPYPLAKPLVKIDPVGVGWKLVEVGYVLSGDLFFLHEPSAPTQTTTVAGLPGEVALINDGSSNNFAVYVFYGEGRGYGRIYNATVVYNVPGSSPASNKDMADKILGTFRIVVP